MNLRELLEHAEVQLPIHRDDDDFQSFVAKKLDAYQQLLSQLTGPSSLIPQVQANQAASRDFSEAAKEVIALVFAGHPSEAYTRFAQGLTHIESHLHKQALNDVEQPDLGIIYRVRKQIVPSLTRKDLFHIPFHLRHLVATQRYSIPGLPCLYFGGSLFTCWAEMGRPPFHELQAAAFWLAPGRKVKILNFSDRPKRLLYYVMPDGEIQGDTRVHELVLTHLILWPLMALCSIVVRHRDGPFKPEYIIPQLLLQWITKEHKFDGICYFSTHVPAVTRHPLPPCNLVFPVQEITASGHCPKLRDLFRMTEPYGWELLRAVNAGEGTPGHAAPNFEFEFLDGRKEYYAHSEFGLVETRLRKLAFEGLEMNVRGQPDFGIVPV
jgi:hypothetical protein